MMDYLGPIIAAAEKSIVREPGDYEEDGMRYCGKCGTKKQKDLSSCGIHRKVMILCKCAAEKRNAEDEAWREEQRRMYISSLRANGLQDRAMRDMRFENDDGSNRDAIDKARRYVTSSKQKNDIVN